MATQVNDEQRQGLAESGGAPVEVTDVQTRRRYYLIAAEEYERIKALLKGEEIDPSFFEFEDEDYDTINGAHREVEVM